MPAMPSAGAACSYPREVDVLRPAVHTPFGRNLKR